jgi:decaprenylphospho-beta-D-erythro-pentofuranosid-2-ulose 2-reductase
MKHALVIGATSDIGRFIAIGLANRGFGLYLTGRNLPLLDEIKNEIETSRENKSDTSKQAALKCYPLDITDMQSHAGFYASLPIKPDIVFCCVGYYQDQKKARENLSELLMTINVNYTGVVSIINIISNDFEKRKSGNIVVLSSVAGERGRQLNYLYGSAKAGLTTYLSGLRNLLQGSQVKITTIQLGPVYTKMSEGHNLLPFLTLKPRDAAEKIITAGLAGKPFVYIFWPWRYIMFAIRMIPEFIFKRLPPF